MAGFIPAIHVLPRCNAIKTWMPGTRPGMTWRGGAHKSTRICPEPLGRHGRIYFGHPRLAEMQRYKDVDARHKVGHDGEMAGGFIYIMANRPNGTLYVGVTGDIVRRCYEHRNGSLGGFTKRYGLKRL